MKTRLSPLGIAYASWSANRGRSARNGGPLPRARTMPSSCSHERVGTPGTPCGVLHGKLVAVDPPLTWNQINTYAKSDVGSARATTALLTLPPPKWIIGIGALVIFVGVTTIIYLVVFLLKNVLGTTRGHRERTLKTLHLGPRGTTLIHTLGGGRPAGLKVSLRTLVLLPVLRNDTDRHRRNEL